MLKSLLMRSIVYHMFQDMYTSSDIALIAKKKRVHSEIRHGLNVSKLIRREPCYMKHIIQSAIIIHDIDIENTP